MLDRLLYCIFVLAIGAFLVLIPIMAYWAFEEQKQWEAFLVEHNCKVVAKVDGDIFNTIAFDTKGNPVIGIGSTPGKTGWLCDDGITYYK